MSLEEKMEADARSIYVGNVCIKGESALGLGGHCFLLLCYCQIGVFPVLVKCPFLRWTMVQQQRSWKPTFMAVVQSTVLRYSVINLVATPKGLHI